MQVCAFLKLVNLSAPVFRKRNTVVLTGKEKRVKESANLSSNLCATTTLLGNIDQLI